MRLSPETVSCVWFPYLIGGGSSVGELPGSCIPAAVSIMTGIWALAALWLGLALVARLLSIWFRIATALSEIVVGTIAQSVRTILDLLREMEADPLVIGATAHCALYERTIGSRADRIIQLAPCPVLVVK